MLAVNEAHAQRLPGDGEDDTSLQEFLGATREHDIESSRSAKTGRKASENKFFADGDSIADMELYAGPPFEPSSYNWEVPEYDWWPDPEGGPYTRHRPDDSFDPDPDDGTGWYIKGCSISCQGVAYCEDREYKCTVNTSQAISSVGITGSGIAELVFPNTVIVTMHPDQPDFSRIEVCVTTDPIMDWQEQGGTCCADTLIRCEAEECDCATSVPVISGATTDMGQSDSLALTLSGSTTCGPWEWEISQDDGDGFSLAAFTSYDIDDVVSVNTTAAACGSAEVTVTDDCGQTSSYEIRCTDSGSWSTIHSDSANRVGAASCVPAFGCAGLKSYFYSGKYRWVVDTATCWVDGQGTWTWDNDPWPPCGDPMDCQLGQGGCAAGCVCVPQRKLYQKWVCP